MARTTQDQVTRSIRMHLADKGESQKSLAARIGKPEHWLSRRMRSQPAFSTDDIDIVAEGLGIDSFSLMLGSAPASRAAA